MLGYISLLQKSIQSFLFAIFRIQKTNGEMVLAASIIKVNETTYF